MVPLLNLSPAVLGLISIGVLLAAGSGGFVAGCEYGSERVQARWNEDRLAKEEAYREDLKRLTREAADRQRADAGKALELSRFLADERRETEALRAALRRAQLVTRPEPTDANPHPASRFSDAFRLCWNAHWTGDPADRAACQAGAGTVSDDDRD